eukprot:137779_1
MPTPSPTTIPSNSPSVNPLIMLTPSPTTIPSNSPSVNPSITPTDSSTSPTLSPSLYPTLNPSVAPTMNPSLTPTSAPSLPPTFAPSFAPSTPPTLAPSQSPTACPDYNISQYSNDGIDIINQTEYDITMKLENFTQLELNVMYYLSDENVQLFRGNVFCDGYQFDVCYIDCISKISCGELNIIPMHNNANTITNNN